MTGIGCAHPVDERLLKTVADSSSVVFLADSRQILAACLDSPGSRRVFHIPDTESVMRYCVTHRPPGADGARCQNADVGMYRAFVHSFGRLNEH